MLGKSNDFVEEYRHSYLSHSQLVESEASLPGEAGHDEVTDGQDVTAELDLLGQHLLSAELRGPAVHVDEVPLDGEDDGVGPVENIPVHLQEELQARDVGLVRHGEHVDHLAPQSGDHLGGEDGWTLITAVVSGGLEDVDGRHQAGALRLLGGLAAPAVLLPAGEAGAGEGAEVGAGLLSVSTPPTLTGEKPTNTQSLSPPDSRVQHSRSGQRLLLTNQKTVSGPIPTNESGGLCLTVSSRGDT